MPLTNSLTAKQNHFDLSIFKWALPATNSEVSNKIVFSPSKLVAEFGYILDNKDMEIFIRLKSPRYRN